jgi:outer membrane protein assembly factor BamB
LALAGGSGCEGLQQLAAPEVPLWAHHPGAAVSIVWRQELTVPARKGDESYERGRPEIDSVHQRVFVGSSDHGLYCLRSVDGAVLWRYETAGAVQTEPLYDVGRDAIYFGSNDGALYALRAADGKLLWRFDTAAEIRRRPVLHGNTLFATNANDTLLAIDPESGVMRWYRHRTPAFGMEMAGHAGPAVSGQTVFAAFSDGVVMAYDVADGTQRWAPVDLTADVEQARIGEELRYLDVDTTPVVTTVGDDTVVIVASYEGGVFALDADSGMRVWNNDGATGITDLVLWSWPAAPEPAPSAAAMDKQLTMAPPGSGQAASARASGKPAVHRVLLGSSSLSGLWGIDPEDGRELWRRDLPSGGLTAAEPVAGAALIGTTRYGMFLIAPLSGGVIDGVHGGGAFAATPAAHGTRAFALSNEGVLFGLHIQPPLTSARRSVDDVRGLDELVGPGNG